MIGFDTNINEAVSPFQRDNNPSLFISSLKVVVILWFFLACRVFNTQNGFVATVAIHPAVPEDFTVLKKESGLNP